MLAAAFYDEGRQPHLERLAHYLDRRRAAGLLAPIADTEVAARFLMETVAWFANHRFGDHDGAALDDTAVRAEVIALVTRALVGKVTAAVAWIAAACTALHLATANLWGYHRDEFYYLACGRRLAWGFVDHPPVTPWLYRLADLTVGSSKLGLRIAPSLLHGVSVLLIAALARELGGSTRAQVLAALAAALAPLLLTTGHFLGTVTVEITIGAAVALVLVRPGRRR